MSAPPRLAVVSTHPIQYYAPLFRALAGRGNVDLRVFYGWEGATDRAAHDPGFGMAFEWDVPLLDGYDHTFVENTAEDPGSHHSRGIVAPSLVSEIEAFGPDALLVFGWNYVAHRAAMQAFHGRVPVLFRGDSTLLDEQGGLVGLARRLARRAYLRRVYRDVDVAVYVGTHNRAYFEAHGLRDDQLVWAPHAIDNARFAASGPEREAEAAAWRRDLDISEAGRVSLFVGKLEDNKDPDVLLDAFLRLRRRLPEADHHLVFCGTGPMEETLRGAASARSDVHFVGFQNQSRMPVVYRLGDVLALPSRRETWGLAVNEAMACGRAAIVSDRTGCAPDLVDEANGRVVPVGDAGALADALGAVLTGDVVRMGGRSAERIAAWSIEAAAEGVEAAVQHARRRVGAPGA